MTSEFQVGTVVRLRRGDKRTGRATISTLDEDGYVSLLWEDIAPLPLQGSNRFLVCPVILEEKSDDSEVMVKISELQPLLPFEISYTSDNCEPIIWKERGDTILKLGDASSAIPYYERALELASKVQIGSTVLIMMNDTVVAAEVDCMDENSADITFVVSNDEAVVKLESILLSISMQQSELQIRVLLNLARALLQISDYENTSLSIPSLCRDGAILACTLAFTILLIKDHDHGEDIGGVSQLLTSSLFLRSKALAGRAKWKLALKDVDKLLALKPQSKEGRIWRKELFGMIARSERTNKKLAKSVCQWIQSTTKSEEGASVSDDESETSPLRTERIRSDSIFRRSDWLIIAIIAILIGWFTYKSNL